jgi:hypothetical protein
MVMSKQVDAKVEGGRSCSRVDSLWCYRCGRRMASDGKCHSVSGPHPLPNVDKDMVPQGLRPEQ